jgi:hypothetical protein
MITKDIIEHAEKDVHDARNNLAMCVRVLESLLQQHASERTGVAAGDIVRSTSGRHKGKLGRIVKFDNLFGFGSSMQPNVNVNLEKKGGGWSVNVTTFYNWEKA